MRTTMHTSQLPSLRTVENRFQFCAMDSRIGTGDVVDSQDAPSLNSFTIEDMLLSTTSSLEFSLSKLNSANRQESVRMFDKILCFMGLKNDGMTERERIATAQGLLCQSFKNADLIDELFMQLIKQTRNNQNTTANLKAWDLFHLTATFTLPSSIFVPVVEEHLMAVSADLYEKWGVRQRAFRALKAIEETTENGVRKTLPTRGEITKIFASNSTTCLIFLLNNEFKEITFDATTTIREAKIQLAQNLKLETSNGFELYEWRTTDDAAEYYLLNGDKLISDVIQDIEAENDIADGTEVKLLLKKRLCRTLDEEIVEPQFTRLLYIQAQYDLLSGRYPITQVDTAHLCALQILAECDCSIVHRSEVFACVTKFLPQRALKARPCSEWVQDVRQRCDRLVLAGIFAEKARRRFLQFIRDLPYGNCTFYKAECSESPNGQLPDDVVIGVNKTGLHIFDSSSTKCLYSARAATIKAFRSEGRELTFKIQVSGGEHHLRFSTSDADMICLILRTFVNDDKRKRIEEEAERAAAAEESPEQPPPVTRRTKDRNNNKKVGQRGRRSPTEPLPCVFCLSSEQTSGVFHGTTSHKCLCSGCAKLLRNMPDLKCPICREPVECIIERYF